MKYTFNNADIVELQAQITEHKRKLIKEFDRYCNGRYCNTCKFDTKENLPCLDRFLRDLQGEFTLEVPTDEV